MQINQYYFRTSYLLIKKLQVLTMVIIMMPLFGYTQNKEDRWKLQLALGVNNPIEQPQNNGYYSKYINFPSVNLGVQHMFNSNLGAKLDLGYNRSSEADGSLEFKLNYTRVNAQLVYEFTNIMSFLPERFRTVAHAGPGLSFTKPLGDFSENTYTYLNVLGGIELHYMISKSFSIYGDVSYALSLSNKNKYNVNGFSFNGDLIYASVGVSISISDCYCY